jgi:hypothetical protein
VVVGVVVGVVLGVVVGVGGGGASKGKVGKQSRAGRWRWPWPIASLSKKKTISCGFKTKQTESRKYLETGKQLQPGSNCITR